MNLPKSLSIVVACVVMFTAACASDTVGEPLGADLVLRSDGIGPYLVGQPADEVIAGLSASIGGPDSDTSEPNSPLLVPDCGEPGTRVLSWGSLELFFVDRGGSSVFATWSYGFDPVTGSAGDPRSLGLVTEEGIGLGSSRDDVIEAYGLRVQFRDDPVIDRSTFAVDGTSSEHLGGRMTTTDPDSRVQLLERRPSCVAP